jgi:ABC-type Fe3+/spermidine/putrescine transport system ATPase subunit
MQAELKRLQRQLGVATLFITHDQDEALALGDRVAVLRQGQLEQVAPPREIYTRPANRFIAEFVGESNLFACAVEAAGQGEVALRWGGHLLVVAVPCAEEPCQIGAGGRATLVVRPEVPQLVGNGARPRNVVAATVIERAGVGATERYRLATASGLELLWHVAAHPSRRGFAPGDVVEIGWEPGDGHLLAE